MSKTKKCNWCNSRIFTKDMYHIGKLKNKRKLVKNGDCLKVIDDNTDYWICNKCNLKEDIV